MKFALFVLPIILCNVCGDDEDFIIPPFLFGAAESVITEMKELLQKYGDKPDFQLEKVIEEWTREKGGAIKVATKMFYSNILNKN